MEGIHKKTEVRINWRKYGKIKVQLEDFIPDLYQATEECFHMEGSLPQKSGSKEVFLN